MNRAESLRIWKWISEGILNDQWGDEGPSEEYVIAQDFIKDVAKKILKAEKQTIARGNHLIRALKLQGKYTDHELEVLRVMELIEDLGHFDEQGNIREWEPGERNRITVKFINKYKDNPILCERNPVLCELSRNNTDPELYKIIEHLRKNNSNKSTYHLYIT